MLDLDHFKRFNDEFGHPAGGRLLKGSSAGWRECLRDVDNLARYGGEEFILLLPAADAPQATAALERLRAATPGGQSFSAGVASWNGAETSQELVTRADRALYEAKSTGRDRIVIDAGAAAPGVHDEPAGALDEPAGSPSQPGRPPGGPSTPGGSRTSVRSANGRGRLRTCPLERVPPSAPTMSAACCDRQRC